MDFLVTIILLWLAAAAMLTAGLARVGAHDAFNVDAEREASV
jgi:fatty-acid desaturase